MNTSGTIEPRYPTLAATGVFSLWIAVLSLPMWSGRFLATPFSDQYKAGYGFRAWAAEQWKTTGKVPLWNPEIFGGMPFVGGMHGDIFYPTAWLRLILPVDVAMNLGFAAHYVLAGLFAYLLLRRLHIGWAGSVVGGVAYQLSGVVASYVNPGHDGKLFVTALFPLALLGLIMALRDKKWEGYAVVSLAVGMGFLSPHPQLLYYMLVASGIFALYLTFGEPTDEAIQPRLLRLGGSVLAILVAFGIGAIQMVPFYHYIPFSPRSESIGSWERATSFAIPWEHLPELLLAHFVGEGTVRGVTYWGGNGIKFHSEYLGLPVVALAVLGVGGQARKRLKWWLGGIATLFMLVALGANTPFYRAWYTVMPFMGQVRAPGMAFYIVALIVAAFAAMGVDRLLSGEGQGHIKAWLGLAAGVIVLAALGGFGGLARSFATFVEARVQTPPVESAMAASSSIRAGALASGVALAAAAGISWGYMKHQFRARYAALLLIGVIGTDLWWNARTFWNYSDAPDVLFGGDEITDFLGAQELPFRVLNLQVYPATNAQGTVLMAYGIPELLGHHGNELHAFDELMGGQDVWRNLPFFQRGDLTLLDLYATRYVIGRANVGFDSIPGFALVLQNVPTASGTRANLFERVWKAPYVRLIPAALKLPEDQVIPTVLDQRFPLGRLVALDSTADIDAPPLTAIPDSLEASIRVTEWEPGHMKLEISPPTPEPAFALVSENWYVDWRATVDGQPVTPLRGDGALITVPLPAGAREVVLTFESDAYRTGKAIMIVCSLLVFGGFVGPIVARRKRVV